MKEKRVKIPWKIRSLDDAQLVVKDISNALYMLAVLILLSAFLYGMHFGIAAVAIGLLAFFYRSGRYLFLGWIILLYSIVNFVFVILAVAEHIVPSSAVILSTVIVFLGFRALYVSFRLKTLKQQEG